MEVTMNLRTYLRGWKSTLRLMLFERETYRFLRDYQLEDWGRVPEPPGDTNGAEERPPE